MEDFKNGGSYSADGRKLRPRKKVSFDTNDRQSEGTEHRSYGDNRSEGEGRSYGDGGRRSHGGERGSYGERSGFSGERRSYNGGDGERGSYGNGDGERRSFNGGGRRSYGERSGFNGERKSYGNTDGGERRSFGGGDGERHGEHRSFNGGGRKPYGERRSFGSGDGERHGERRSFSGGERRPYGERRSFGSGDGERHNGERRSYGDGDRKPYGERRSFGSGDGERHDGERRSFNGGERKPYGERRSFGGGERKPYGERRGYGERRSFGGGDGERHDGEQHGFGGGERRSFGGGDRKPFGERRSFGGGERRSFGGPKRGGFGRPQHGGFNKRYEPQFDESETSGINKMINNRPQLDSAKYSDFDYEPTPIKDEMRLNKFIANSGVCSRREADTFIQAGVVTVNGEVVTELGTKINVVNDDIRFNGERLKGETKVYIVMNKPKGYVTTSSDPHADKTVMDLLKACPTRVFPVGRLDKTTTGVLMFTNDGEIAEKLTHPSYDKKKIYQVLLDRELSQEDYEKILSGVTLSDGEVKADELQYLEEKDHRKLGIEIHSGKNRIVRRIFESLGYDVKALDRVYFAGLTKKGVSKGEWRYLSEGEVNILKMGAYV